MATYQIVHLLNGAPRRAVLWLREDLEQYRGARAFRGEPYIPLSPRFATFGLGPFERRLEDLAGKQRPVRLRWRDCGAEYRDGRAEIFLRCAGSTSLPAGVRLNSARGSAFTNLLWDVGGLLSQERFATDREDPYRLRAPIAQARAEFDLQLEPYFNAHAQRSESSFDNLGVIEHVSPVTSRVRASFCFGGPRARSDGR